MSDEESRSVRTPEPGIISISGEDGRKLLAIHPDGTVTGAVEDASDAARRFVEGLRILTAPMAERDALTEQLAAAQAIIGSAPHHEDCRHAALTWNGTRPCDEFCWKAQSPADALEAHDLQVAAKTLTDAADEMCEILRFRTLGGPTDEWLRARAASLASEPEVDRGN